MSARAVLIKRAGVLAPPCIAGSSSRQDNAGSAASGNSPISKRASSDTVRPRSSRSGRSLAPPIRAHAPCSATVLTAAAARRISAQARTLGGPPTSGGQSIKIRQPKAAPCSASSISFRNASWAGDTSIPLGRLDRRETGDGVGRAAQREKPRQDLRDVFYGLRRQGACNAAGASRDQALRHQTPVGRKGIEANLLFERWPSQRCHWRFLPKA